jgi:hypothetical protein
VYWPWKGTNSEDIAQRWAEPKKPLEGEGMVKYAVVASVRREGNHRLVLPEENYLR